MNRLKKTKKVERKEDNQLNNRAPQEPTRIEDVREIDENFVFEEDSELLNEEKFDEFASCFEEGKETKIFLTTNEKPSAELYKFIGDVMEVFPRCYYWKRMGHSLPDIVKACGERGYTDIMVFRENRKKVDELILMHLPKGPTAIFKVSGIKNRDEIYNHGNPSDHYPELILNNFNTKIGSLIGVNFRKKNWKVFCELVSLKTGV